MLSEERLRLGNAWSVLLAGSSCTPERGTEGRSGAGGLAASGSMHLYLRGKHATAAQRLVCVAPPADESRWARATGRVMTCFVWTKIRV